MRWGKLLLFLYCIYSIDVIAQTCPPNISFEQGTFDNWTCLSGTVDKAGVLHLPIQGPVYGRQALIAKPNTAVDRYGGFPILCPNGSAYSIQLGDDETPSIAEQVSYTFVVPNNQPDYTIFYNYAVVLQDPAGTTHTVAQKPEFTANIYDVTDSTYINCASFSFYAGSNLPGFKLSPVNSSKGSIYYKDWTPSSIDLHSMGGKTVRLEFTARCCTPGGHFGYAYIGINENCATPISGNSYCTNQTSVKLYAPTGFYQYFWYTADFSKLLGSDYSLRLSPAPANNTRIALRIVPYEGLGCPDTVYTTIKAVDAGYTFKVPDSVVICPEKGVTDLTSPSVVAGSSSGLTYSFYTDSDAINYLPNPQAVTQAGVYYIKGTSPNGCSNILPIKVAFHGPTLKTTNPAPVTYPATIDLTKTFVHNDSLSYAYYGNAQAQNPLSNYTAIYASGTYYIKATDKSGCQTIQPVVVVVNPPPPPVVTAPNTFTPNNDGSNDAFQIAIKGYVRYLRLQVFSRSGELIFTSTDISQKWDGTYNGRKLPVATYYWVFNGTNTFYNTPIVESGPIAIVR